MRRPFLTALLLLGAAPAAFGYAYQAQTGALSYTFFNLSPHGYVLTPYGGGAGNPLSGDPASTQGWNNLDGTVGFFNSVEMSGGSCHSPDQLVRDNAIFFNDEHAPIIKGQPITLDRGASATTVEVSIDANPWLNLPAIADSWTIETVDGGNAAIFAAMASAGNMFISGIEDGGYYPYCGSQQGLWYNAGLNPPAAPDTQTASVNTPYGTLNQQGNPLAPYFTDAAMNFNVNPNDAGYVPTGGLWTGVYNTNSANLAVNSLNLPMYPVNLSAYVASNPVNSAIDHYAAPIYGGHLTFAIGDPFLVSSYAAKILWFLVTNTGYAFSDTSLSAQDLATIQDLVAPDGGDGVFASDSVSSDYAAWLLAAPSQAVSAIGSMNTAAQQPITHESIWGKVFSGLVDAATHAAEASIALVAGPEASVVAVSAATKAATAAGGSLDSYATSQITADFTTTESLPPPVAQNAPPVINPTYASNNLLGMFLTNAFVQAEIKNTILGSSGNPSAFALWSNYSISTEDLCNDIGVDDNLFNSDMGCGTQSGTPTTYANALSLYQNSYSTAQLSLWSAALTGADVTVSANGYPQLGSPSTAVFQPPTQLVNLTGASSPVSGVDPTFALDTGIIGIAGYSAPVAAPAGSQGTTPSLQLVKAGSSWDATVWAAVNPPIYSPSSVSQGQIGYWAMTGSGQDVTVTGVQIPPGGIIWAAYAQSFSNGPQTLDYATCAPGAPVNITMTPISESQMEGALSCAHPIFPPGGAGGTAPASPPTVNVIVASPIPADYDIQFFTPVSSQISYVSDTGVLTVNGYLGSSENAPPQPYPFVNADSLALNLADCAVDSGVNLFLYPMGGQSAADAVGVLACADGPPVMPYSLCTQDTQATGGVVVGLTGAPAADGTGATFDLGCACIPSYLGGPDLDTGATIPLPGFTTFWQTGTDASGDPVGLMVGATASNPTGLCN